jgi:hypothetical protein
MFAEELFITLGAMITAAWATVTRVVFRGRPYRVAYERGGVDDNTSVLGRLMDAIDRAGFYGWARLIIVPWYTLVRGSAGYGAFTVMYNGATGTLRRLGSGVDPVVVITQAEPDQVICVLGRYASTILLQPVVRH